ncbi:MAG: AmmeMemoRadiSam system protein B [Candidatus Omnitrophica bacterium]|nr:AmmeMemoRadiSam system protein B [Candidatus Omnitrophota bacterium]MBI3022047.1 AmmeMemoRadiSam system protein B [Candidatus Omnitrophota bacterium]
MSHVVRRPAVAGYYYPADPVTLKEEIDACTATRRDPRAAFGALLPHGSFRHCGDILGATLSHVSIPRRCIVLGPSHTGSLIPWRLLVEGAYRTPLGDVPIDEACAQSLRERCPFLEDDPQAQQGEHAVEVLLPFLQRLGPEDLTVVPIVGGSERSEELQRVAEALAQVVRMQEEPVLLLASSDLSHYARREQASEQDHAVIDAICDMDDARLTHEIRRGPTRMCGYGAAACMLGAARALGARHGTLVSYGTSADAGGDPHSVIGYAGIVIR